LKQNENNLKKNNLEKILNELISIISDYYEKENEKIGKFISELNKLKIETEKKIKIVYDEFKDAKNLEKINVREKIEEFRKLSQSLYHLEKNSEKIIKLKTSIDFKTFNYPLIINYNNNEEPDKFEVKEPFAFNIFVKKYNGNIIIKLPLEVDVADKSQKNYRKNYKLIPRLLINGKLYSDFKIQKIGKNNNISIYGNEEGLIQTIRDDSDSSSSSIIENKNSNNILSNNNIIFEEDDNISNIKTDEFDQYYEYKLNTDLINGKKEKNEFILNIHSYSIRSLYK
jgi:hypothetical protein